MNTANLFYKEGSSDKVYLASVEASGGGYVVNFSYGRVGNALQSGFKTQAPVTLEEANKIFTQLINSKLAKGYQHSAGSTPAASTVAPDKQKSGLSPQLLNPIDEDEADKFIADDAYMAQEKFDGKHKLVRKTGSKVEFINRRGIVVGGSTKLEAEFAAINHDFIIDGEDLGDELAVFDLLEIDGQDLRGLGALARYKELYKIPGLTPVVTSTTSKGKKELYDKLKENNKEGIVFKLKAAPYVQGRPASGGSMLKLKFWASASCRVLKVNAKRSVAIGLLDAGTWIDVGNVTIPGKIELPQVGDIIEVKYLYAYKGGSLFQPIYLGIREDILQVECKIGQLKYKNEDD